MMTHHRQPINGLYCFGWNHPNFYDPNKHTDRMLKVNESQWFTVNHWMQK